MLTAYQGKKFCVLYYRNYSLQDCSLPFADSIGKPYSFFLCRFLMQTQLCPRTETSIAPNRATCFQQLFVCAKRFGIFTIRPSFHDIAAVTNPNMGSINNLLFKLLPVHERTNITTLPSRLFLVVYIFLKPFE